MIRLMPIGIEEDIKDLEDIEDKDHMKEEMKAENEGHARGH